MDVHDASLPLDRPEAGDGELAVSATREPFDTRATPALVVEAARMDANIERMRLRLAMPAQHDRYHVHERRFAEHQGYLAAVRRMVNTGGPTASA